MISAACIVGHENAPLYLEVFRPSPQGEFDFHWLCHGALDYIDTKVHLGQESAEEADGQPADQFLGLLYVTEEYSVYGYLTNTRAKILLVVEAHLAADESELRARCLALHKLYAHAVASPFRDDGDRLDTPGFCDRARAALGVS